MQEDISFVRQTQNIEKYLSLNGAIVVICFVFITLNKYIFHSTYLAAEAYSHPSIIHTSTVNGTREIVDDMREAYYWIK